jgi:FAD/FMN-containing dehydrogenase
LIQGEVSLPGESAYERARQILNGAVNHRPALFVFCKCSKDVQEAVRIAQVYSLPLSVRGGGHDWAGRALRDKGLVIDLSRMRRVAVDLEANVATVEGGATAGDLASACAPYGFVAVTGAVASVGVVGLTLGGGYGPLRVSLRSLLKATVGAIDGERIKAS